jgi:hypothetical protein
MTPTSETILATLPGSSDSERLLLVLVPCPQGGTQLELRQQSFAAGLGWFNQSTVTLEAGQVALLRQALGSRAGTVRNEGCRSLPSEFHRVAASTWQPRVVHADSA